MEFVWIIYWLFLVSSFIFSIFITWKYRRKTGMIQLLLTIAIPIWALCLTVATNWVGSGTNEFMHIFELAINGSISAIGTMFGYLVLIGFFIYHIFLLVTLRKK